VLGEVQKGAELRGAIQVDKNSIIQEGTKIEGPVVIGEKCEIGSGCKIGPYVEIGSQVRLVENVVLENTVVMNNTIISNDVVLKDSIVGEHCQIGPNCTASGTDGGFGVVIGDKSKIGPDIHFHPNNTLGPHSQFETKLKS
jgi:NDP-sugar pyrophosphorylase family protein